MFTEKKKQFTEDKDILVEMASGLLMRFNFKKAIWFFKNFFMLINQLK